MRCNSSLPAIVLASACSGAPTLSSAPLLPIVDLGYDVHQASMNTSGSYYNFTNIRYAQSPIGDLRFSPPLSPAGINKTVNDGGGIAIMCPQMDPAWEATAFKVLGGANISQLSPNPPPLNLSSLPTAALEEVEDCLFLDVMVPTSIFLRKDSKPGAPVMVWIYGGGFVSGSKTSSGNPAGILERAQEHNGEGVIFVALNYRLGIFGWLSGPTYQQNATSNLGLQDQALALKWIQDNIHLFGGDPNRVTVLGESAGGSSILAQLTAYGGTRPAPFKRAIIQSPAYIPIATNFQQEDTFNGVLSTASLVTGRNISTTQDLRELSETQLYEVNAAFIYGFPYGYFTLLPTVDGNFNTKLPEELLAHGQFDHSVEVMVGANANEGAFFADPFLKSEQEFTARVKFLLPGAPETEVKYITETLYPPVYDGSFGYRTLADRVSMFTGELYIDCKGLTANEAYASSYSYTFAGRPGYHTQDIAYTFYNNGMEIDSVGLPVNAIVARIMQEYFVNFAITGKPNFKEKGAPLFPAYGTNAEVLILGSEGILSQVVDPKKIERCVWWQEALFY